MRDASRAAADLSGRWSGIFNYPKFLPPTSFSAELSQRGPWIVGRSEEIGQRGPERGLIVSATFHGRRDGSHVKWLKTYDRPSRMRDAVAYEGTVNDDGTEISGRWTIPNNWSGTFLMIRQPGAGAVRALEKAESR